MSFFTGTSSLLSSRSYGAAGRTPTRADMLGRRYQPFANPFFDHANTYLPADIKSLFRYCRYYHMTHGVVNAIGTRSSEYSVTDLIVQHEASGVQDKWEELLLGSMNYRVLQFEINLDYHVFGNAFVSVSFPFKKRIKCATCNEEHDALNTRSAWRYTNHQFWLTCPSCSSVGFAKSRDVYISNPADITLIRWSPEYVSIHYNEATGRMDYTLQVPPLIQSQVETGRKDIVSTLPEIFLQAVKEKAAVVFDPREVFHMRQPSLSSGNRGWGIPRILPVLKDAFYMQIMKKAQECVHPDTLLDTKSGLIAAGDVVEGTELRTHKGTYEPVIIKRIRPMNPARGDYTVTFQLAGLGAFPSTFSDNHPMQVLCLSDENECPPKHRNEATPGWLSSCKFEWLGIGKLSVGDYVGFPIRREAKPQIMDVANAWNCDTVTPNWIYLDSTQEEADCFESNPTWKLPLRVPRRMSLTEDLAYYMGKSLGEDTPTPLRLTEHESAELMGASFFGAQTIVSALQDLPKDGDQIDPSTALTRLLAQYVSRGKVPQEIQHASDEVVASFLFGYIQWVGRMFGDTIEVTTLDKDVAYTVWRLALSLQCIGSIDLTHTTQGPVYTTTWDKKSGCRLRALMYKTPALEVPGGQDGFFFEGRYVARISQIKKGQCEEVISLEVANEHTFCVPGMATHNSILLEHIIPQNFIYPQPAAQGVDPFVSVDLSQWRDKLRSELARQRVDPAYTAIVPFPIGHQSIGGQGRSLLLMPEIQQVAEHICVGMGFPTDLVFGNGNYAGTSVSMRMLENFFLANVQAQHRLLKWAIKRIGAFLGWPLPEVKFKPFRMADDLQRQGLNFQLNQAGKLSNTTLLSSGDFDLETESKLIAKEVGIRAEGIRKQQLFSAEIMGEAQVVQAKAQARAEAALSKAQQVEYARMQQEYPQTQAPPSLQQTLGSDVLGPGGMSLDQAVLADQRLNGGGGAGGKNSVDMRPQPEVLPPRRTG